MNSLRLLGLEKLKNKKGVQKIFKSHFERFESIHSKRSTTFSNVPGPEEQVMLADQPVKSIMFFTNH